MLKQRMDGGKPLVPGTDTIPALAFQPVQELGYPQD